MERIVASWMVLIGFDIAILYFIAYLNPKRNAATQFIESYLSRRYGGLRIFKPRQSMLLIAIGGVIGGIIGIIFFFREGWWQF